MPVPLSSATRGAAPTWKQATGPTRPPQLSGGRGCFALQGGLPWDPLILSLMSEVPRDKQSLSLSRGEALTMAAGEGVEERGAVQDEMESDSFLTEETM